MTLRITLKNATDLPNVEKEGKLIDPYVALKFRGLKKKTSKKENTLNPVWDEEFQWTLETTLNPAEVLQIELYDSQPLNRKRLIGSFDYSLGVLLDQKERYESLKLIPSKNARAVKNWEKHRLYIDFCYSALNGDETAETHVRKYSEFPEKPVDFQVHIHIFEGHRLEGNNINPFVSVACDDQYYTTSYRKATNNPVYDETVMLNFKMLPVELFEKSIEIKVIDRNKKKNYAIGVFSIDVGSIYNEPSHSFIHKWLVLSDCTDPSFGARGFLKVSLTVLGPGDDPVFLSTSAPDETDIESNLLRPFGIRLQAATMMIRLYSAEDLPRMDPGLIKQLFDKDEKTSADPFAIVSFAGKSEETQVENGTQNPEWNKQINIGYRFPSVSERVRIQVKDKDNILSADDFICTSFINLYDISAPGDYGFLPTFGPCYVNVYGSPSGFSFFTDKYEDMNKGLCAGVAYRGRVLLELETHIGTLPKEKTEVISVNHQKKLERIKGRKKYVLLGVFHSASMIQTNDAVEFEVSIGNYGKLDKDAGSTTHSAKPLHDGTAYYFVAWDNKKPHIVIENNWEDCSYRINALNVLCNVADDLEKGINAISYSLRKPSEYKLGEYSRDIQELLDSLQQHLKFKFPSLPTDGYNKLDYHLWKYRISELSTLWNIVHDMERTDSKPQEILDDLRIILRRIRSLAVEPQNSIPDVIILMLAKGKPVASCRIPSHLLMYSSDSAQFVTQGSMCGKLQSIQLNPPRCGDKGQSDGNKHSCIVQMVLWLGFDKDRNEFSKMLSDLYGVHPESDRKYITFKKDEYTTYQLRAYLYQARNLYGADHTGLSDPYCIVSCGNTSCVSKTVKSSLSPKWSQTLVLDNIHQYGSPQVVQSSPPVVVVELYDKDTIGQNDYLGVVITKPLVRMTSDSDSSVLDWFTITRYDKPAGEVLAGFELIRIGPGGWKPETLECHQDKSYDIPKHIKPFTREMKIEVQCLGVRDMRKYNFFPVNHPFIEVECEGVVERTGHIVHMENNPMFPHAILTLQVDLPVEDIYSPPINIHVFDRRVFGYTPLVGSKSITSLKDYEKKHISEGVGGLQKVIKPVITQDVSQILSTDTDHTYDWWSKYYASVEGEKNKVQEGYLENSNDKLIVYSHELEEVFNGFSDVVKTFPLFKGKGQQDSDSSSAVGYFKGALTVCEVTDDSIHELPEIYPQEVIVRVYIVKGIDLQARDIGGSADPYVKVVVGKKVMSDKINFIVDKQNAVFGRVFELPALLPYDNKLTISVMDHDYLSVDDVIGSTTIDLENRFLSLHRPLCGLPESFSSSGPNRWRDFMTPVDLLNNLCHIKGYHEPIWENRQKVTFNSTEYLLQDFEKGTALHPYLGDEQQRLALHILKLQHLVPEHVETRTLYSQVHPGVPQGFLQLWVDIFPNQKVIPPKVDVTPRQPDKYVLRVVVWKTSNVLFDERSLEITNDIYVKGILSSGESQNTDIHYFSLDGEGMFNWRFVFPFEYDSIEKKIIIREKKHFFSLDATEHQDTARLVLQVWDNDWFSADDFLGTVEVDLHDMPLPALTKRECGLNILDNRREHINLVERRRARGWLPVYKLKGRGEKALTGKLHVWFELLTEEEEKLHPAGKGREEPNQYPELKKPDRPSLSFTWFAAPWKTFKFSIWRKNKILCVLVAWFLILFISFLLLL